MTDRSYAAATASRTRQTVIGLGLAAANVAAWLAVHFYAMFLFDLTWLTLPFALLLGALQCWLSVGLFIISHDAMHGSLAPGRPRINSVVGASLLFLYAGFAWDKMRSAHFEHHKKPGSASDPDFDPDNPRHFGRWYMTFLKRYFGWQSIVFVFSVVSVYWFILGVPVQNIVLLYGAPAIASSVQLFYFGTFRPHRHSDSHFADTHNARSEDFGVLASLASCFHFGYHHEHHLSPNLPWWALPNARRNTLSAIRGGPG
ncbi:fatty acid desaturase [Altererythrobacter aquiaggeris]|uniref:fatty acid desaturase n=1 Tax=Aestuarierythrobacter aquiaggeris TaxID=1898396 RepID=UPI003019AF0C